MSQLQTNPPSWLPSGGTVSVTNGLNTVSSQAGADWSQVRRGHWFAVVGSGIWYTINADPVLTGGVWEITLSANYGGPTNPTAAYAIQTYFAPNGSPILAVGDSDWMGLLNRWMQATNSIGGIGGGSSGLVHKQILITGALIGDTEIYCAYDPVLNLPPSFIARPVVQKQNPADDNRDVVSIDSVTDAGFSMNLSGPAIEGQVIHCAWIPSTGTPPPPPPPPPAAAFVLLSESGARLITELGALIHTEHSNPTLE